MDVGEEKEKIMEEEIKDGQQHQLEEQPNEDVTEAVDVNKTLYVW